MNESPEKNTLNKSQAEMHIRALWQEAVAMGNNDYEHAAFDQIIKELQNDDISPDKAVEMATAVRNSKLETSSM